MRALVLFPLVPAAMGCAGAVSTADGVDAEATTTSAVVAIERTASSTDGSRAEASARFIRVTASSSSGDVLHTIGAALDLPAAGTCASISSLASTPVAGQTSLVELLDVGEVVLRADGVETRLAARQLPDVTDVVSGVIYDRATDSSLLPASTSYLVRVAGGHGLEPFETAVAAPGDPADVRIVGEDTPGMLVASSASVELSWVGERLDDVVYVDIRPNGVRCVLDGSGHGTVSTLFLDDDGTLVVHRLRREPLLARGVDWGEVRFDFARTVAYVRR